MLYYQSILAHVIRLTTRTELVYRIKPIHEPESYGTQITCVMRYIPQRTTTASVLVTGKGVCQYQDRPGLQNHKVETIKSPSHRGQMLEREDVIQLRVVREIGRWRR